MISVLLVVASSARAQMPSTTFFPIGVHSQPTDSFAKWQSRGVNSLFQYESLNGRVSMDEWDAAAEALGLYYARWPSANPANDLQKKNLMAWTQYDEPDLVTHNPNPAANIDYYQNLKAISPSKAVWGNFAGPLITPAGSNYTQWVKSVDWVAEDWYPVNWGRPDSLYFVGLAMDRLRAAANGAPKRYMAYIETSYQWINTTGGRAPTTGEFRAEIWNAINHGATGLIYFSQVVGRAFQFDGTTLDIVDEMTKQDSKVTRLSAILTAPYDPAGHGVTASDAKFDVSWRSTPQGDYFFVLNLSNTTLNNATMTLTGLPAGVSQLDVFDEARTESLLAGNTIIDSFAPYELHVYRTNTTGAVSVPGGAAPIGATPIPEPATVGLLAAAGVAGMLRRPRRA